MEKIYEVPVADVVVFEEQDLLAVSGGLDASKGENITAVDKW